MSDVGAVKPRSILIVDDEAEFSASACDLLQKEGFYVTVVRSGEDALHTVAEASPVLVLSDISMPGLNGLEMLEAIHKRRPGLPVIFMTGQTDLDRARTALVQGAFDFVQKPFAMEELLASCRRAAETVQLKLENMMLMEAVNRDLPGSLPAPARPERAALERATLARVIHLLGQGVAKASIQTLEQALSEPAPSVTLTSIVADALLEDPIEGEWAAALLRGAQVQRDLLQAAGGALSAKEVGKLLGISRAAVDKRRRQGSLLGLKLPSGDVVYPAAQFDKNDVVPGLPEVLGAFHIQDPWMQLDALLASDESLGGHTGFEALAAGDGDRVRSVVSSFGDQGL